MNLFGARVIAAMPDVVFAAMLDPAVLKPCIPGCDSLTGSPAEGFEAVVSQKVGPVTARYTGTVTVAEAVPGRLLHIKGQGTGGLAGFAKGGARVTLTPAGGGTQFAYEVDALVGGRVAKLGNRIIEHFAKGMVENFLDRFQHAIEHPGAPPEEVPKKGWIKRLIG